MVWQIYVVLVTAAGAAALSAWLVARTAGLRGLPGCGEGSACNATMTSRWSQLGLFPVAGFAAAIYAVLGVLAIFAVRSTGPHRLLETSILCIELTCGGTAAWFVLLQFAVVRRWCVYCNIVHLLGAVGLAFAIGAIHPSRTQWCSSGAVAAVAVAFLITGQFILQPSGYAIVRSKATQDLESRAATEDAITIRQERDSKAAPRDVLPRRQLSFLDNRVRLNTAEWPMLGVERPERFVAFLFDFTCTPCRAVHDLVSQVSAADPELGVLLLPLPQHPACNPLVKEVSQGHGYACQYARLGLAVWRCRPDRYNGFERFLFSGAEPPPIGLAVQCAAELCGTAFDPYRPDEEVDRMLRRSVEIYRLLPVKKIPALLFPHAQVAGQLKSPAELKTVLARELYRRSPGGRPSRSSAT